MFVMLLYLSNVPLWYFIQDLNLKKTNWKKEFLAENKMKRLLGMWICLKRKTIEKWGFWALNLSTKHTTMNENNFLVRFNNGQYFGVLFYGTWRNLRIWVVEHTGKIKKVSLMKDLFNERSLSLVWCTRLDVNQMSFPVLCFYLWRSQVPIAWWGVSHEWQDICPLQDWRIWAKVGKIFLIGLLLNFHGGD